MADGDKVSVLVVLEDPSAIDAVAQACEVAGLTHIKKAGSIGLIIGSVAKGRLPALEALKGVKGVEVERGISVAPPDSPVQ